MPNPYVNKVVYNGTTLIDLTADTTLADDVAEGKYFHLASGERVQGTLVDGDSIGYGAGSLVGTAIVGSAVLTE